ncbi:hypothetical protein NDU88_004828 [Pleurodeles waltl]|uniref:Uncharacterized protein n=1 Tax=Pleurodeles waltl TaxID=8319 RepID=A0AAV7W628_PLEWA|nr:hypothetical protein NDU88_004828 [Pleurodeles waltl]
MTSRPIRIEDGRDVRGRGGGQRSEAGRSAAVARSPAPRGPYFSWQDNKGYYNATGCLASFIHVTTNGDEGHSFNQGPRV